MPLRSVRFLNEATDRLFLIRSETLPRFPPSHGQTGSYRRMQFGVRLIGCRTAAHNGSWLRELSRSRVVGSSRLPTIGADDWELRNNPTVGSLLSLSQSMGKNLRKISIHSPFDETCFVEIFFSLARQARSHMPQPAA